jgi:small conductance mechanosensitive channel
MTLLSDLLQSLFPAAVWEAVWERVALFLPKLAVSLVILAVFWLVGKGLAKVIRRVGRNGKVETSIVNLLAQTAKGTMILFGGITALGTLGIDVSALVAGLGLTGLALGLALKEIISNALSGILVIIYKPFREGDLIAVTTFEGTVREINLRFTTIEAGTKKVFIPNAMVISNAVVISKDWKTVCERSGLASPQRERPDFVL